MVQKVAGRYLYYLAGFCDGFVELELVGTLIVLIPKGDSPVHSKNFSPISLCNVNYKIITKVLVNYLRPFLSDLFSSLQGSFTTSRGTIENAMLPQVLMH